MQLKLFQRYSNKSIVAYTLVFILFHILTFFCWEIYIVLFCEPMSVLLLIWSDKLLQN